ncbi:MULTISPECIES: XkdF-like putative serine protease domain-containing protein [Haloferacaceae]|uniref:XkdF-like putative serine protease domain-containing protein n=1 Tax=Halorubrum glutamatedens TaxID=2707018 RepID=A0ABD5QTM3_9EURY|nr:XkdF-like putative serine protease domain-containing protein [Halobellus captivus]
MPPVTKAGGPQFRKGVEFVTKDDEDDDEQVAAGIVMVPDKADLQNDFAREETIRSFADQFEAFVDAGEAGGGIMHAVFPDGWMDLERNEVLDESEEIGGQEVDAGAWVQEWAINHDDLWELILEDVISGYSIGAIQVAWNGPFEQDELDDVDVPEELGDELVWELVEGIIREVSAVDIPAVPDAEILDTKAAAEKRLGDYLGDPNGFVEEAQERGHSEDEAEQLWDVLTEAAEEEGAGDPGEKSVFHRIGKAALDAFLGEPDTDIDDLDAGSRGSEKDADDFQATVFRVTAPEEDADDYEDDVLAIGVDFPKSDVYVDWRNEVFPDELEDPHVSVYGSIADLDQATGNDTEQLDTLDASAAKAMFNVDPEELATKDATGGDTPDDDGGSKSADSDMGDNTNDNNGGGDNKSLAEQNAEQITELTESVKGLTEALTGPEPKTAEIQIDGETHEVREDAAKAVLGIGDDDDVGEAIERLNEKAGRVDELEQRVDTIARQGGGSTQLDAAANGENGDRLDDLGKALS